MKSIEKRNSHVYASVFVRRCARIHTKLVQGANEFRKIVLRTSYEEDWHIHALHVTTLRGLTQVAFRKDELTAA